MTVTELMIQLASLPGDLEVVIDVTKSATEEELKTEDGELCFKLEVITTVDVIDTSDEFKFVILNCPENIEEL